MDQTTYFSYRCPACGGRARVASAHAGQVILCPHCQAQGVAQPDMQPHVRPTPQSRRGDEHQPGSTTRFARPLDPATTSTIRRRQIEQATAPSTNSYRAPAISTGSHRAPAPLMDGFSTEELQPAAPATATGTARYGVATANPGTATVQRRMQTPSQVPATNTQPGTGTMTRVVHVAAPPRSPAPLWTALGVAVICGGIAVWAFTEANGQNRNADRSREERIKAEGELAVLKIQSESQEKRLAEAQVQLAAEKANTIREREITAEMQRTISKMSEELARIARTGASPDFSMVPTAAAVQAVTAPGAFPTPGIPTAGVPNTRKDKTPTTR